MENEKEMNGCNSSKTMSGEEIVITGISGVFPNSASVLEFGDNLFNKVDMVSDKPRWTSIDLEIPKHVGKISDIDKFDAQFFKVGFQQANVLEPLTRKILEHAYGAVFDSGNTHITLKGAKIGVFIGSTFGDFSSLRFYRSKNYNNFVVSGSSKSMIANRVSYWIDGKGPSFGLDFSCASSAAALEKACNSIKDGSCDAAVIGSGNICSHPYLSLNLRQAGLLCLDGKTKCFDKNADGYVRAEAVSLLFLQKAKDAKRIYAEIYHAKGMYELKPDAQFLPERKSDDIQKFLMDFYSETDIVPEDVEYIEANGAAIGKADENELDAIGKVFASEKTVKVGCVKSNMGHSEAVSGLTAVTKICLAYHKGEIPANLHYNEPIDIPAVKEGKVQILTEHAKFDRGFAALNNFAYTGANAHIVLKGHYKKKDLNKYKCQIPRIVLATGRRESGVSKIFEILKSKPIDAEEIALLHNIFEKDLNSHTGRGYTILDTTDEGETASVSESIEHYSGVRRPLWFVYSGMGSQWAGMGADLMRIPTFKKAIERCHKVLEPKGVDIIKIISEPDKTIFDNILNAFVGIGAVQIGLTDILKEMGVEPDYIIGHSLGEMACAYHDNTFTADELILATYSRGKAVFDTPLVKGSMAAVGVGYKSLVSQCPPKIDIACHNSSESSTISGPYDIIEDFVAELTEQRIFAKKVSSANIAYHSRYVADAGPALLQRLREVIKHPKLRSKKWISTSVPKEHWDEPMAKYSSPEYHTNNLLTPVLFEEMISMMPSNAVVVEIAPHSLLQPILKRSHPNCTHIPLTKRGCPDSVKFLLDGIGELYKAGYNPKVNILYPKVEFPVSTETPLLSHLVEWEHSEIWPLLKPDRGDSILSSCRDLVVSLDDDDYKYITGHIINGSTTIPEAALLVYVWETLAMYKQVDFQNLSIIFKDIHFHSEVIVKPKTNVKLSIIINKGNDHFEISQDDTLIVSGKASGVKTLKFQHIVDCPQDDFDDIRLHSEDIYKIFSMRGFSYLGALRSIHSINIDRNNAFVKWTNDWVSFLDSLIQLNTITRNYNGISKPKFMRKLRISVVEHKKTNQYPVNRVDCHTAYLDKSLGITRCAGVEIDNITYVDKPTVDKEPDVLKEKSFFPYFTTGEVDMKTALEVNLQIIAENANSRNITIVNSILGKQSNIFKCILEISDGLLEVPVKVQSINDVNNDNIVVNLDTSSTNVLLLENLLEDSMRIKEVQSLITKDDFILTLEDHVPKQSEIKKFFSVVTCMTNGKQILVLLKKLYLRTTSYFPITMETKFSWVSSVYGEFVTTKKVVLVSENQPYSGLLGFVKKMKKDGHSNISLLAIHDFHAKPFTSNDEFYRNQLEKNLSINILKKGQWGGYYYIPRAKSLRLRSFSLKTNAPGDMDKMSWVEAPPCSAKNTIVQVCYSGLSLNDCQKVTNDFKNDNKFFGMDFSGIDKNGDKVMGIIHSGAMSSTVEADPDLLWPVPDHWSLEDAATVPLPYVHAYYCLVVKKQLTKGQRVLVTGGAGALGQAVIALCLALDCTVFTTVSEMGKKLMLLKLFPRLNENNISYSDQDSLYNMVMVNTQNQGCHLVINCATGYVRKATMKCVSFHGLYLELSNHDMLENEKIGMSHLQKIESICAADLSNIFRPEYARNKKILQHCLSEGIARGIVTPLTRVVYSPTMVSRAFRLLSLRRNRGRVLIRLRDPVIMNQGIDVLPRLTYTPQDVVIIVCDEKGLGLELAERLIERGAKKIIIHMKPSVISGYEHTKFISWSKHEVSVKLSSENLHIEQGCASLMKNAMKFGKVKGVFIVQDGKKDGNGEKDDFIIAYNKKCSVVLNLDLASRNCAELRHFTIVAHLTQNASDEYALSLSERVCELRNEMGLPALVIRYESLVELHESKFLYNNVKPQTLSTFFNSLETSLKLNYKNVVSYDLRHTKSDFLEKMTKIMGVRDIRDLENETTLQDLHLNEICLKEIRAAVRTFYSIDYPIQKIERMTIKSFKELSKIDNNQNTDFESGMSAFYKEVDSEEDYLSQQSIVAMPTLLKHGDENAIDPNGTYVIMIPGLDGCCDILKAITERLKIQAVGVYLGPDVEGDSIREIAEHVRKLINTKIEAKSKFYILGYSFGVNIALELASILEDEGQTGVVYCLDSSPGAMKNHIDAYLGKLPEDKLQNSLLNHMYSLMTGQKNENLKRSLEESSSFEEKIDCTLSNLHEKISYSKQYKRYVLESAYKRIKLAMEYNPKIILQSELVLMKGIAHPKADNLAEDYNLSQYTKKPVKIFEIESDHGLAHQDTTVPNIVNKFLDKKILDEFRKTSLCYVYIVDS